jgi:Cu/Ag efflux protein CusF
MKSNLSRLARNALIATVAAGALAAAAPALALPTDMSAGMGSSQTVTAKVTVKSVDLATRHLTVVGAGGETFTMKVPASVQNLPQVKAGDTITATYTREVVFAVSPPNSPLPADTETAIAARAAKGEVPAAVVANHVVVTGAVVGIDMEAHTLQLVDPQGGQVHTVKVTDPQRQAAMAKLKVGDTITVYVTESLLVAVG